MAKVNDEEQEVVELLNELRVVLPGVQVLGGKALNKPVTGMVPEEPE